MAIDTIVGTIRLSHETMNSKTALDTVNLLGIFCTLRMKCIPYSHVLDKRKAT